MYHVGTSKRGKTLVIQAVTDVDCLDCETYDYLGQRIVTKKHLYTKRYDLLNILKAQNPRVYGNLRYAVVE